MSGHCVRKRDGSWNSKKSKVYRSISLEECENLCNENYSCEAFEDYPEYKQCLLWMIDWPKGEEPGYQGNG